MPTSSNPPLNNRRRVCFALVIRRSTLASPPMQRLLDTLQHRQVRRQLEQLAGYDTEQTGEIAGDRQCLEPVTTWVSSVAF